MDKINARYENRIYSYFQIFYHTIIVKSTDSGGGIGYVPSLQQGVVETY